MAGITGPTYFDASRNAEKPVPMGRFLNGEILSAFVQLRLLPGLRRLEDLGAALRFARCDVTDRDALEVLLNSLPELNAVIHGAMALRDAPLATLTQDQLSEVMAPKVRGASLLHELCRERPLERFVLLSSMASVLGNPGQGAYAAAILVE